METKEEDKLSIPNINIDDYSCGMPGVAQEDFKELSSDFKDIEFKDIDIDWSDLEDPDKPWNKPIKPITLDDLTECKIDGNGVFDRIMRTINIQLNSQFEQGRIIGHEYATTYQAGIQYGLQNSISFLISQQQVYWDAVRTMLNAQAIALQIVIAKIDAQIKRIQYYISWAQLQNTRAQYALTKANIAQADIAYCDARVQYDIHKKELILAERNIELAENRIDSARAETKETLRDETTPVQGIVYLNKLQTREQTRAFINNAKSNLVSMQKDIYSIKVTNDEGYPLPDCFNNDHIQTNFSALETSVGMNGKLPDISTLIALLDQKAKDPNFLLTKLDEDEITKSIEAIQKSVDDLKNTKSKTKPKI